MKTLIRILVLALLLATAASADQATSNGTTREFYDWYLKAGNKYRDNFDQAKPYFTDKLHSQLSQGFKTGPNGDFWIDFDPFINAQVDAGRVTVSESYNLGDDVDLVEVTPFLKRGDSKVDDIRVYCVKVDDKWVIANLVYTGARPFSLQRYLKKGLGE